MTPVVYGLPGVDLSDTADRGEIELGGCVLAPDNPDFVCRGRIRHHWQRADRGNLVAISTEGRIA